MDKTGASPLYLACERGNAEVVELLLSRGANPNIEATDKTKCPMHAACKGRHYDSVKLLLEYNAGVAVRDNHGKTALHIAVANRCSEIVELLLKHGSNVDDYGSTPLHYATQYHPIPSP